jgi:GTPase SAR1 family protein
VELPQMSVPSFDLAEGKVALSRLLEDIRGETLDLNEADTRHRFIDRLIHECLGWDRAKTHLERRFNGEYSDYELGTPPGIVIEAKRAGIFFEIPSENNNSLVRSIRSLCALSNNFTAAFGQAQKYCADRGIQIGAVCNATQIVVFLGVRNDGIPPNEGKCLLFNGWEQIESQFPRLWQALSPDAEHRKLLLNELIAILPSGVPTKLSSYLPGYPKFRYPSESQQSLRTLSDLLIEDAPNTPGVRKRFYEECYCESGALAREAMVGKNILSARYAAMFNPSSQAPTLQSLKSSDRDQYGLAPEVVAEALGRRPIVIIGDVGVGKTSFIRHLVYVKAAKEIENAIFIYIDLGSQASLGQDLRSYFINEIERQLLEDHGVDLYEDNFVRGVYHGDLQRFERGIYGRFKDTAPDKFFEKQIEHIESLISDKISHLQRSIQHISKGRRKQIVISIDNADQRNYADQQEAFLAAQEFSARWHAVVLISLRPQTYFVSKSSGSISAYPQRILTISPPRVDVVLQKRLQFSLDLAEGRLPLDRLEGISIKLDSIALFLKALMFSLKNNKDISELLSNVTGGNIREALEIIKGFIGSANVDSDKIIEIMRRDGNYMIPLHEFTKQALLGEYSHYHSGSSLAYNLFDVRYPEPKEHFLSSVLIGFLLSEGPYKSPEGFVQTTHIVKEMQSFGFVPDQIEHALRRLTNKKLIETTERVTFDQGLQGLVGDMPLAFRATTVGAYHIQRWACSFAYLDAMLFDTPIFDDMVRESISERLESFDIKDRYKRAWAFAEYLDKVWGNFEKLPTYFDWVTLRNLGQETFLSVKRAIDGRKR